MAMFKGIVSQVGTYIFLYEWDNGLLPLLNRNKTNVDPKQDCQPAEQEHCLEVPVAVHSQ